uniref:Uncharacterized protein n=1 Tax=Plectus sambesii TaxID=2011161 RepID=A0A914ULX2_9BILA
MDQGRGAHSAARPLPPPPKPPRPPRPPRPTGFRTLRKADSVCVPSASSPARPVQQLRKQTSVSCNQPQDGRRFTVQCGDVSYVIDGRSVIIRLVG